MRTYEAKSISSETRAMPRSKRSVVLWCDACAPREDERAGERGVAEEPARGSSGSTGSSMGRDFGLNSLMATESKTYERG
jgi:hypothetical protein